MAGWIIGVVDAYRIRKKKDSSLIVKGLSINS